jgi:hypothetical protein
MRYLTALVCLLALTGCGSSVFRSWKSESTGAPLNLAGGKLGTPLAIAIVISGNTVCNGTLLVSGNEENGSGILEINSGEDSACSVLQGAYTFDTRSGKLSLCKTGGSCGNYVPN